MLNISKKQLFFFITFSVIMIIYISSYVFSLNFSIYGLILFSFLFTQLILSILNKRDLCNLSFNKNKKINILVVGYRENPEYWKKCIESILNQSISFQKILFSIDGDEEEDIQMGEIAKSLIPSSDLLLNIHGGKRSAIIYGYQYLQSKYPSDYIIIIDSDTILDENACLHIIKCIDSDDKIGCVTSNIKIFNKENFLTKIINARYSYAFNIERSYLSYLNIMNCCSGPLSIYRSKLIDEDFIQKFKNQSCCKHKVEPGDDRHQTLLIMMKGYKSKMSPYSICWTECPTQFKRFLRQQLRWMRSFYREQYWQYKALKNQPYCLSLVMTYEILFPYLIIGWVLYLFYNSYSSIFLIIKSFILTTFIALIRTIFIVIYTNDLENIYNIFYLYIYFVTLIPLKVLALFTIFDNNWITSNRLHITSNLSFDIILMYCSIIIWNILLINGFFKTLLY